MNKQIKVAFVVLALLLGAFPELSLTAQSINTSKSAEKPLIHIILGSTRQGRSSEKIGKALQQFAAHRTDIKTELVDLRDFKLPFLDDEISPATRTVITDSATRRWSDKVSQADAFIIVVPEYNSGYPGVLKNALDSLYKEWNGKAVAFVGYSGGSSGGTCAVSQLRTVAVGLEMNPVAQNIHIPQSWKAFDDKGKLVTKNVERDFNAMVDQLLEAQSA